MRVKYLITLIAIVLSVSILACSPTKPSAKDVEIQAQKIAQRFDSNTMELFKDWNYSKRGMWYRIVDDSVAYSCAYGMDGDTIKLRISLSNQAVFMHDFPSTYSFDTSRYNSIYCSKYKGTIKIKASDNQGHDHLLTSKLKYDSLFKSADPFGKISKLYQLRDSFDFREITYRKRLGNFIQFYLYPQYKLTYLPDDLWIDPQFKNVWFSEFAKGKMIKKNWNLRKLKENEY